MRCVARLLVNEQSFWAEACLCCCCKKNNINIKWLNQSIHKKIVRCRRISESHRIFRPGTLIVMLYNFVVIWDASSCTIGKSKEMSNSVKRELKIYHETWAVAFSESGLQVWFVYGVVRVERCLEICALWDIKFKFLKAYIVLNFCFFWKLLVFFSNSKFVLEN